MLLTLVVPEDLMVIASSPTFIQWILPRFAPLYVCIPSAPLVEHEEPVIEKVDRARTRRDRVIVSAGDDR
jgi:hypothetical protein